MNKTFEQCKDEVVKKYGYGDWEDFMLWTHINSNDLQMNMKEAAELYAQAKLKEVLLKAIEMARYVYWDNQTFKHTEQEIIDKFTNG